MTDTYPATRELARRVVETDAAELPDEVIDVAEQVLLDGVSNMLAGSQEPMSLVVRQAMADIHGPGGSTVIGHRERLPLLAAVYVNSTFCHSMDFEIMWYPLTHPTSPVLPALLAIAETRPVSGRELLTALALGFEVQGRLRKESVDAGFPHLYGFHPPGVVGVLGAAAASARLLGLDVDQTAMAIGMACSRAGGVMANTGSMTKAAHSANAARQGLEAALLVERGVTANPGALEGVHGLAEVLYEGRLDLRRMVESFGRPYRMVDPGLSVKRFPSQYPTHWSIQAALELREAAGLAGDEIERVQVTVGSNNESARRGWPTTGLEGKFSLSYVVACALLDGRVEIPTFRDERLAAPDVQRLKDRIEIVYDDAIDAMDFSAAQSTVRVETVDGRVLEQTVVRPLGIWDNPLDGAGREEKFRQCAHHAGMPATAQDELLSALRRARDLPDADLVVELANQGVGA
jgi:aconitate decarboxylase